MKKSDNRPLAKVYGARARVRTANDLLTQHGGPEKTYKAYDWITLSKHRPPLFHFRVVFAVHDGEGNTGLNIPYSAVQETSDRPDRLEIKTYTRTITLLGRNMTDEAFLEAFNTHRISCFRQWHPTRHNVPDDDAVYIDKITVEDARDNEEGGAVQPRQVVPAYHAGLPEATTGKGQGPEVYGYDRKAEAFIPTGELAVSDDGMVCFRGYNLIDRGKLGGFYHKGLRSPVDDVLDVIGPERIQEFQIKTENQDEETKSEDENAH